MTRDIDHVTHETSFVVERKLKAAVPQFELNSAESLRAVQDTLIFEVMNSALCAQFECPQPWKGSQRLCDVAPTELWNYVDIFVALYGKLPQVVLIVQPRIGVEDITNIFVFIWATLSDKTKVGKIILPPFYGSLAYADSADNNIYGVGSLHRGGAGAILDWIVQE